MRSRPPSWTRHACPAIAFAIAAVGIVSPIFQTSFLGDDAFNSYLDGWRAMHHASLVGTIGAELGEWDIGRGRFIPLLQILNVLQFHVFHAPLPLKILQAATIGANVATLYFVVRAFGASAVRARHNTLDGGALVVARISRAGNRVSHIADATIVERFRSDAADSPRPLTVFGGFATRDFVLVGRSETSATYSFQPRCRALSVDVAANDSPTRGSLVFGTGFSTEESDADRRWRWAGPFARLSVGNANATALDTELIASIGTVGAAKGTLAMSVRGTSRSQALDSHGRVLDLHVVVPPQSTLAVDFTATAPNVAIVGDARDLRFRRIDAHLQDAAGCAVADRR